MPNCEVYHTKMPVDTKPKIHEGRKSSKPLMEKRRRARINESLGQLKSLILEATNKDSSRHSKLEKADILEMTVKHLRTLQRNHLSGPLSTDPSRFRQGYSECIHEVARFFTNVESVASTDMRMQLINHLANCCNPPSTPTTTTQPSPPTTPVSVHPIAAIHASQTTTVSYSNPVSTPAPAIASAAVTSTSSISQPIRVQISPAATSSSAATTTTNVSPSPVQQQYMQTKVEPVSHITNNVATPTQVVSGIPVGIPGTLPTGEITLVLPPQALPGGQLPSHFIPVYAQSAPVLSSPTLSSASQGPVSAESPKAYAQVHFPPAVAQSQTVTPQQISPSIATVQAPTVVAVPAPNMQAVTPVMRHTKIAYQTVPEPVSPPKTVLQPVNAMQVPVEQEPVWRPWSHRE